MDRAGLRATPDGWGPRQAHLVGIGGRGMTGLAQVLVERGFAVSASGRGPNPMAERLGIRLHEGHAPGHVPRLAGLLVYAPGVARDDPERLTATRLGVPQASFPEILDRLMQRGLGVAIAGHRGASAAAAMVGWTLAQAGLDPTVVLGTPAPQLGGSGRLGGGPHYVVEAVQILGVILNLERRPAEDHPAQIAAVRRFAATVPRDGYVLAAGHNTLIGEALRGIETTVEQLSLVRGFAWWGADLREEHGRYRFRAFHKGRFVVEARLQVPGRRNVLNALAAIAVCDRMDVPTAAIKEGLEEFAGLSRGLESRGNYRGVTLVDDEAQDPWSVAEALTDCRRVVGRRRLWSLVQPDAPTDWCPYASAFAAADRVVVADGGRAGRGAGAGARDLVRALASAGVDARWAADLDGAVADLDRQLEPGDVLLTLGAGDVGKVADALSTRRLPLDRHGR
jgi:UDP-N-acetylmuramate--alanine ligase